MNDMSLGYLLCGFVFGCALYIMFNRGCFNRGCKCRVCDCERVSTFLYRCRRCGKTFSFDTDARDF